VVTNVDATCRHYLDATEPWPVAEGSVEYVFSDNVIEHLSLEAGRAMLREAFRALRPGGIIRLVTPDVRRHVEAYLAGQDALHSRLAHEYVSAGLVVEHAVDLIRIPIGEFGHHVGYVYDFATLADELELAGFHSIVRCDVGVSTHDALDGLDMRVALGDGLLAVEATR
jgi:SAM-dependent methyltransferase